MQANLTHILTHAASGSQLATNWKRTRVYMSGSGVGRLFHLLSSKRSLPQRLMQVLQTTRRQFTAHLVQRSIEFQAYQQWLKQGGERPRLAGLIRFIETYGPMFHDGRAQQLDRVFRDVTREPFLSDTQASLVRQIWSQRYLMQLIVSPRCEFPLAALKTITGEDRVERSDLPDLRLWIEYVNAEQQTLDGRIIGIALRTFAVEHCDAQDDAEPLFRWARLCHHLKRLALEGLDQADATHRDWADSLEAGGVLDLDGQYWTLKTQMGLSPCQSTRGYTVEESPEVVLVVPERPLDFINWWTRPTAYPLPQCYGFDPEGRYALVEKVAYTCTHLPFELDEQKWKQTLIDFVRECLRTQQAPRNLKPSLVAFTSNRQVRLRCPTESEPASFDVLERFTYDAVRDNWRRYVEVSQASGLTHSRSNEYMRTVFVKTLESMEVVDAPALARDCRIQSEQLESAARQLSERTIELCEYLRAQLRQVYEQKYTPLDEKIAGRLRELVLDQGTIRRAFDRLNRAELVQDLSQSEVLT